MKIIILILFPFFCSAQFGTIKVAFLGDSYCNGCCVDIVGNERPEAYRYLIRQRLGLYYSTVTEEKICLGGETIRSGMPPWYPGSNASRNIDVALATNPDLILLQYSGNHFANGIRYDTVKYCYQYLADTLRSLGKRFIFCSANPRKVSFPGGGTYITYQDTAMQFNSWLYANYPDNSVNVFDHLYDPAINKPVFGYLGSDSLHWNPTGYQIFADDIFEESSIIDTLIAFEKPRLYNITMTADGDSVEIAGHTIRSKNITVSTSGDGITFTERYNSGTSYNTSVAIRVKMYEFVKLVATNNDKIITLTRTFIPD